MSAPRAAFLFLALFSTHANPISESINMAENVRSLDESVHALLDAVEHAGAGLEEEEDTKAQTGFDDSDTAPGFKIAPVNAAFDDSFRSPMVESHTGDGGNRGYCWRFSVAQSFGIPREALDKVLDKVTAMLQNLIQSEETFHANFPPQHSQYQRGSHSLDYHELQKYKTMLRDDYDNIATGGWRSKGAYSPRTIASAIQQMVKSSAVAVDKYGNVDTDTLTCLIKDADLGSYTRWALSCTAVPSLLSTAEELKPNQRLICEMPGHAFVMMNPYGTGACYADANGYGLDKMMLGRSFMQGGRYTICPDLAKRDPIFTKGAEELRRTPKGVTYRRWDDLNILKADPLGGRVDNGSIGAFLFWHILTLGFVKGGAYFKCFTSTWPDPQCGGGDDSDELMMGQHPDSMELG